MKKYTKGWKEISKYIRLEDNYTCRACGYHGKKVVVHHVDGNKENDYRDNLVTLCRTCHLAAHSNSRYPLCHHHLHILMETHKLLGMLDAGAIVEYKHGKYAPIYQVNGETISVYGIVELRRMKMIIPTAEGGYQRRAQC